MTSAATARGPPPNPALTWKASRPPSRGRPLRRRRARHPGKSSSARHGGQVKHKKGRSHVVDVNATDNEARNEVLFVLCGLVEASRRRGSQSPLWSRAPARHIRHMALTRRFRQGCNSGETHDNRSEQPSSCSSSTTDRSSATYGRNRIPHNPTCDAGVMRSSNPLAPKDMVPGLRC